MLVDEVEYFLAFNEFPWFKTASAEEIYNFEFKFGKHLHWPDLDVDLEVDSFKNLEKYKLKFTK